MKSPREHLTDWLRDAYAMETQALQMMENMESRLEHYPEIQTRLRQHIEETRRQGDQVRDCLKQLGTDTSAVKTTVGGFIGAAQAFSGAFTGDEVVKGAVFSYGFEQWEIANYEVLIHAAEAAGEMQIATTLRGILQEEIAMADWLRQNIPMVVTKYLGTGEKR